MHPDDDGSPLPDDVFTKHMAAVDLVYHPLQTKFLSAAITAGAKAINGLGMLIHQGVAALELWSGKRLDICEVYSQLEKELKETISNNGERATNNGQPDEPSTIFYRR